MFSECPLCCLLLQDIECSRWLGRGSVSGRVKWVGDEETERKKKKRQQ